MAKLLQINVTANWGSTGKIADMCNQYASARGWECYEIYGRYQNSSSFYQIKIGSKIGVYTHYLENILFDNEGLGSRYATRNLIKIIKEIAPDVIHLHNIHDHWLNYKILFNYLNQSGIPIVWTFHDFWAITGHCSHFVFADCDKFEYGCSRCPYLKGNFLPLIKQTKRNFNLKKNLFSANKNLTIVSVSDWVCDNVKRSFLNNKKICVIPNGVDTKIFSPVSSHFLAINKSAFVILAVSSQWKSGTKGLKDYLSLSKFLKPDELIVLVGVTDEIKQTLPSNILGITRTNDQKELAALYTRANVVCSLSSAETFGLTIVEGYACGTPAVVYDNTALPSLIHPDTGIIVPNHDVVATYQAIQVIKSRGKDFYKHACIKFANTFYSKDMCYNKYVDLYESLI